MGPRSSSFSPKLAFLRVPAHLNRRSQRKLVHPTRPTTPSQALFKFAKAASCALCLPNDSTIAEKVGVWHTGKLNTFSGRGSTPSQHKLFLYWWRSPPLSGSRISVAGQKSGTSSAEFTIRPFRRLLCSPFLHGTPPSVPCVCVHHPHYPFVIPPLYCFIITGHCWRRRKCRI